MHTKIVTDIKDQEKRVVMGLLVNLEDPVDTIAAGQRS